MTNTGIELIEKSGYKKRFIAAYLDISESMLTRVLNGERNVSLNVARRLATLMSQRFERTITLDELFPEINSTPMATTSTLAGHFDNTQGN